MNFKNGLADGGQYALIGHGSSGSDLIFAKSCSDCVRIEKTKVVISLESRGLKCVIDKRCGAPISEGEVAVTSNANIAVELRRKTRLGKLGLFNSNCILVCLFVIKTFRKNKH